MTTKLTSDEVTAMATAATDNFIKSMNDKEKAVLKAHQDTDYIRDHYELSIRKECVAFLATIKADIHKQITDTSTKIMEAYAKKTDASDNEKLIKQLFNDYITDAYNKAVENVSKYKF